MSREDVTRALAEHRPTATEFCAGCDWTPVGIPGWREMDGDDLFDTHRADVLTSLADERLAQAEAHVVHVTAEPIAEDVVWCEACEEWVTAGPPEAASSGDAAPRTDADRDEETT
jgi:hypothetical protein